MPMVEVSNGGTTEIYDALVAKGLPPASNSISDIVARINSIKAVAQGGGIGGWASAGQTTLIRTTAGSDSWTSSNHGIQITLTLS